MSNPTTDSGGALGASPVTDQQEAIYDEKDRLVLLTPCYDSQVTTVFRDAVDVAMSVPTARFRCGDGVVRSLPIMAMAINQPNDSHIDRARNTIVWHFEQTHYRFACFCDGDQPFEPEHIARTWAHLMKGVRVVGGLVAMKTIVPTYVCNAIKGELPDPKSGLVKVQDIGTGWLGFNRDVLADFRAKWPDISYKSNSNTATAGRTLYAYFASGVVFRDGCNDWLSEDWMFCHRCKELGIPVYADIQITIRHLGRLLFPPPPADIIEAALAVTSGVNPPYDKTLSRAVSVAARALLDDIKDQGISVLHATRGRPEKAKEVRAAFFNKASRSAKIEYIFAVDEDDQESREALKSFRMVVVPPAGGIVRAINAAAKEAKGKILVMAADDCLPPQDWDVGVIDAFAGQLHEPRVLMTSDGYSQQFLCSHPVMTRAFYKAQGYFFCPEYPHLFCDTELTLRAADAGQLINARQLVFQHQHPMFTGVQPDALHVERNSKAAWEAGKEIFNRRNPKHAQK